MRRFLTAVLAIMLSAMAVTTAIAQHKTPLYRGGIAWNDYGHGPTGGRSAAIRNNYVAANGWSGLGGYSSYRPYYNNWSGNVSVGYGRPYRHSGLSYYYGPAYGGYAIGGYGVGGYGYGYGYDLPYYYDYRYGDYGLYSNGILGSTYYSPRYNYIEYDLPSVYAPAEINYGPQAVKQFLGVDRNFGLGPLNNPAPRIVERKVEVAKPVVKEIDWDARKKADQFIELGDQNFQKQKFHDALLRYRMAVNASPDYAVAHLRHAFSLVAQRRYEEASKSFTKAFTLDPEIVKSGFRIDMLYADNRLAREAHQESLAQAALDEPNNGDLHFVVGMWLLFNGELDRSRKFFEKARDLGVVNDVVVHNDDGARDL
jgi:tetratricopeptide (TPR) repeat protein